MDLPFSIDLNGKTAVVTGGGGVLCGLFAKALAGCGANVAILDLRLENAQKVAAEITKDGGNAKGYAANVLEKASLERVHEEVLKDFGACDILINGAGGNHPKGTTSKEYFEIEDLDKDDLITFFDLDQGGVEFVFNLNFIGTLLPSQVFVRDMLDKQDATIINISSMNAFCPLTKIPAYSAAKSAVSNLTQWMAVHFANQSIRVNAIAPGFFITNQNKTLLFDEEGMPTLRAGKILTSTPMSRFGEPEELLGTLRWLIDETASGFVTGTVIPVDGGFSAYSGV